MRKLILFCMLILMSCGVYSQTLTTIRVVKLYEGSFKTPKHDDWVAYNLIKDYGDSVKTLSGTKIGMINYYSGVDTVMEFHTLIVDVPYGECPQNDYVDAPLIISSKDTITPTVRNSIYSYYGEHIIAVSVSNDSSKKGKPLKTWVQCELIFQTPDGKDMQRTGPILDKRWDDLAAATNQIIPNSVSEFGALKLRYSTYLLGQSFLSAKLRIRIFAHYSLTKNDIVVWKYYKPKKG
jgi:hypothetical protein